MENVQKWDIMGQNGTFGVGKGAKGVAMGRGLFAKSVGADPHDWLRLTGGRAFLYSPAFLHEAVHTDWNQAKNRLSRP
jgi:hypothetical protein